MKRLLVIALGVMAWGCQTHTDSAAIADVAILNLWSSPTYPSLTFRIRNDNSVNVTRIFRGRRTETRIALSASNAEELLRATRKAYREVLDSKSPTRVYDGSNIRIVLVDGDKKGATLMHYSEQAHSLEEVRALFRRLGTIVPEGYWARK
jgi:hypothetical protein